MKTLEARIHLLISLALHARADYYAEPASEEIAWITHLLDFRRDVPLKTFEDLQKLKYFLEDHECLSVSGDAIPAPVYFDYDDGADQISAIISSPKDTLKILMDDDAIVMYAELHDKKNDQHDTKLAVSMTPHQVSFTQLSHDLAISERWWALVKEFADFRMPHPSTELDLVEQVEKRLRANIRHLGQLLAIERDPNHDDDADNAVH